MNQDTTDSSMYVVGRRAVIEALESDSVLEKVFFAYGTEDALPLTKIRQMCASKDTRCSIMDRRKFQALEKQLGLGFNDSQGVIAIRGVRNSLTLEEILVQAGKSSSEPILVVLDGITDPHNLGAIARSIEGAGAFGMVVPTKYTAPITPVAVKASAGALEHLPIARVPRVSEALKECKRAGWRIIGASSPSTALYNQDVYGGPIVIVIGDEGEGLHPSVLSLCDVVVGIPMLGHVSSLNASVAAGIILFAASASRSEP